MRIRTLLLAAVVAAPLAPAPASAQDVVVMRRQVSPANIDRYHWDEGAWTAPASCSDKVARTRTVACVDNVGGGAVADQFCRGTKPASSDVGPDYSACQYRWDYSLYGAFAESCSNSTTRTRTASCVRYLAATPNAIAPAASDASCTAAKDKLSETSSNYSGCSFQWRTVDGACVGDLRAQTAECHRSGGSTSDTMVTSGCDEATRPAATRADVACQPVNVLANGEFSGGVSSWDHGVTGSSFADNATWAAAVAYNDAGNGVLRMKQQYTVNGKYVLSDRAETAVAIKEIKTYVLTFRFRGTAGVYATVYGKYGTDTSQYNRVQAGWGSTTAWSDVRLEYVGSSNVKAAVVHFDLGIGGNNAGAYVQIDDVKLFEKK